MMMKKGLYTSGLVLNLFMCVTADEAHPCWPDVPRNDDKIQAAIFFPRILRQSILQSKKFKREYSV